MVHLRFRVSPHSKSYQALPLNMRTDRPLMYGEFLAICSQLLPCYWCTADCWAIVPSNFFCGQLYLSRHHYSSSISFINIHDSLFISLTFTFVHYFFNMQPVVRQCWPSSLCINGARMVAEPEVRIIALDCLLVDQGR